MRICKAAFCMVMIMYAKLDKRSLCFQCLGCNKLEDKSFIGKVNCNFFRPTDKKVWCADEAVNEFNNTGKVK